MMVMSGQRDPCRSPMQWDKSKNSGFTQGNNTILGLVTFFHSKTLGTVEPGISKLFQKHKTFTIARCLLSKGFAQMNNMGIISVLNCPRFEITSPFTIQGSSHLKIHLSERTLF